MREFCFHCFRPQSSCMCMYFGRYETKFRYVILMHPMEFKKVKNNTGMFTHRQLVNSEIITGIDFTHNKRVNELISKTDAFILYPGDNSKNLDYEKLELRHSEQTIFIIDATWPCAKKMLKLSENLKLVPRISFDVQTKSQYKIKKQPKDLCLSTIESVHLLINKLAHLKFESKIDDSFLRSFHEMNNYQLKSIDNQSNKHHAHD